MAYGAGVKAYEVETPGLVEMNKILLITIPILLAVAVGVGALIAFSQFDGKSSNPVKNIRRAVSKHDTAALNALIDVDAVLENAAEEILTAQINSKVDVMTYSNQEFTAEYEKLHADFITVAKSAIDEYVKTGKVNFQPPLTDAQKFFKDSEVTKCKIKSFSKPKTEGDETHMTVELFNEGMNFYFALNLKLEKVEKSWRVIGAKGFESYIAGYNRALRQKLEALNAPIRAKIKESFDVKGFGGSVSEGDEYGFSKLLHLTIKADVKSDKPIYKISGNIILEGREGREGITPFSLDMVGREQGTQTFEVDKILNPFVREDVDVMRHGLRKDMIHIEVTQVEFIDGSTLKQFDSLPDN